MSHRADINSTFEELIEKIPNMKGEILACKFGVFESLEWDNAASEVVEYMIANNFTAYVDSNMRCYLQASTEVIDEVD